MQFKNSYWYDVNNNKTMIGLFLKSFHWKTFYRLSEEAKISSKLMWYKLKITSAFILMFISSSHPNPLWSTCTYIWCILYIFTLITWQMGGILQSFLKADKRPLVLLGMMVCEDRISHASVDDYIALSICLPLEVGRRRYSSHRPHKQK